MTNKAVLNNLDFEDCEIEVSTCQMPNQFTWRAAVIGSLLGCLIGASNLYLGLKAGWTFPGGIFGAASSFVLIKLSIKLIPIMGPDFSIQENCTAQTAATTSGGLNVGFITCIPAMYRLGLLSVYPSQDILRLYLWTLSAATYGMFFAIPFRSWFVVRKDYPFPSPRATAETIRLLHATSEKGEVTKTIRNQALIMTGAFLSSLLTTIVSYWVKLLDGLRVLFWIGNFLDIPSLMAADKSWRWYLAPDLALIGSGFIIPANVILSLLLGSFIAYGLVGPLLLNQGFLTAGMGLNFEGNGSAQALFLWSGISLMLFGSLSEVILTFSFSELGYLFQSGLHWIHIKLKPSQINQSDSVLENNKCVDTVPLSEQIPTWWWVTGTLISVIGTCLIMGVAFNILFYQSILSVLFAFFLGIVALQASAETDINPVSTLAKVVQLLFAFLPANSLMDAQRANLLCGCVTSSGAAQSADMVGDLKTGALLGASPKSQFYAQLVGTLFGIIYIVPLFLLYTTAYPCILHEAKDCEFGLAPVLAWQNTTVLLTKGLSIADGPKIAAGVSALLAIGFSVIKVKFTPERIHSYLPHLSAVGIDFILAQPSTPLAMTTGLFISHVWFFLAPKPHNQYHLGLGAGALAGAGLGAAIKATLAISGITGATVLWGTLPINS